jgi:signal transduction histidine kinase
VKHAGDARVTMTLTADDEQLCLTITDDGCGFGVEAQHSGVRLGLISMQERARIIGGRVDIHSELGVGTTISACAPWDC